MRNLSICSFSIFLVLYAHYIIKKNKFLDTPFGIKDGPGKNDKKKDDPVNPGDEVPEEKLSGKAKQK